MYVTLVRARALARHVPLRSTGIAVRVISLARGKPSEGRRRYVDEYMYGYVPDSVGFVADEEPSWRRMASLVIAVPPRLVL